MTPPTAQPEKENAFAPEDLARIVASDETLRGVFRDKHDTSDPEEIASLLQPGEGGHAVLSVVLRPELAHWVRDHADRRGGTLSEVVRPAAVRLAGRVLAENLERPAAGVCPAEPGTRTEYVSASVPPGQRTLIDLAADRWDTPPSRFGAEAVARYREAIEEAE